MAERLEIALALKDAFSAAMGKAARTADMRSREIRTDLQKIGGVISSLRAGILGFAAALGARRLIGAVRGFASEVDRVGKEAEKLGVPVELLSNLGFAAQLAGVEIKQMEVGIQRLIRKFEEFRQAGGQGTKESDVFLRQLGLSEDILSGEPFDRLLLKFSDALNRIKSQATRLKIGQALFDSEGVANLRIFQNGAEALQESLKVAADSGATITKEMSAQAALFNDEILKASTQFETIMRTIALNILPDVSAALQAINEAIPSGTLNLDTISKKLAEVNKLLRQNREQLIELRDQPDTIFTRAGGRRDAIRNRERSIQNLERRRADLEALSAGTSGTEIGGSRVPDFFDENASLGVDGSSSNAAKEVKDQLEEAKDSAEKLEKTTTVTKENFITVSREAMTFSEGVRAAVDQMRSFNTAARLGADSIFAVRDGLAAGFNQIFTDARNGVFDLRNAFKTLTDSILADISRILARRAATAVISTALNVIAPGSGFGFSAAAGAAGSAGPQLTSAQLANFTQFQKPGGGGTTIFQSFQQVDLNEASDRQIMNVMGRNIRPISAMVVDRIRRDPSLR